MLKDCSLYIPGVTLISKQDGSGFQSFQKSRLYSLNVYLTDLPVSKDKSK